MRSLSSKVAATIATILLSLCAALACVTPASAYADDIDLAAAGHGAARVVDTYKTWTSSLYNVGNYDYTYKIINYTSGYNQYGPFEISSYGAWSPTAGLGAWGTVHLWQYTYTTY